MQTTSTSLDQDNDKMDQIGTVPASQRHLLPRSSRNTNDSHQQEGGALERARVTFDEETNITYIKDISANCKPSLFYTKSEINCFQRSNAQALHQMQAISDSEQYLLLIQDTDTAAFLGLEVCLGQRSYQESVMRRGALRDAIKSEQSRQERLGICDCDALANISEVKSQWSRQRARAIALLHADA